MGAPRRKFPGGSVGQYFVIKPPSDNGDAEQAYLGLTEQEAFAKAQEWANDREQRIYIARYVAHADPADGVVDAKR